MDDLSSRLRSERERMGLTQEEFGMLGHVKKHAQYNYEKGERLPDVGYLAAVAAHGVDVVYVLTGVRMDETTREHLMRAMQVSVQIGDPALSGLSMKAVKDQAVEIRRKELMAKLEQLGADDVNLLYRVTKRFT